jgi:hypothetical protein
LQIWLGIVLEASALAMLPRSWTAKLNAMTELMSQAVSFYEQRDAVGFNIALLSTLTLLNAALKQAAMQQSTARLVLEG